MANLMTESLAYPGADGPIQAYLARPAGEERRPGVIVIHEIWGLSDHIRDVAGRIAAQGYAVLAPNLYSRPELAPVLVPENIREVMRFRGSLPAERQGDAVYIEQEIEKLPPEQRERVRTTLPHMFAGMPRMRMTQDLARAVDYLNAQPFVLPGKIGSIGFCFGGSMSIRLACEVGLAACILFYGDNPDPIELVNNIAGPVMGIYGAEDMRVNAHLHELVGAMVRYKKPFEMKIYTGAAHAFFNDTSPQTYRPGPAQDAWERVVRFFGENLGT